MGTEAGARPASEVRPTVPVWRSRDVLVRQDVGCTTLRSAVGALACPRLHRGASQRANQLQRVVRVPSKASELPALRSPAPAARRSTLSAGPLINRWTAPRMGVRRLASFRLGRVAALGQARRSLSRGRARTVLGAQRSRTSASPSLLVPATRTSPHRAARISVRRAPRSFMRGPEATRRAHPEPADCGLEPVG